MKTKLDLNAVKNSFCGKNDQLLIGTLQTVAFVAAGGGIIGRMYAESPADAYRDARAGKAPYNVSELENIRLTLIAMAEAYGLNPHKLPQMPQFHSCGVF
jgi:hypothetical protein